MEKYEKYLTHLAQPPHDASVKYFLETGKITGGFRLALVELINAAERNGAIDYKDFQKKN